MSRHDDLNLEDLFCDARAERSSQRWQEQRDVFRRLRLGGGLELFATRVAHAAASSPRRIALGALGGMLVLSMIVGTTYVTAPVERAGTAVETTTPSGPVDPPRPETSPAPSEPVVATTSVDALPSAPLPPSAPSSPPRERRATASSPPSDDDLARELASVSAIRAKLAANDYASARRAIRAHRATFAHGALVQEVSVLEIEALRGLGNDRERCRLGRAFLRAHPTSAYRERVLALMGDCNDQTSPGALHDEPHSAP
jgi:hypothetical protein